MKTTQEVKTNADQKMQRTIDNFKANLAKVRTGRAHTGLLDHIQVDYYGAPTALSQVANVNLVDSRTIGVQPYEKKMVAVVEKAIRDSDLGLNPATSGDLIRVPMPALTEERRRELTKVMMTLNAFSQMEGPFASVRRTCPPLGEVGFDRRRVDLAGLQAHEPIEDLLQKGLARRRRIHVGVEYADIARGESNDH